MNYNFFYRKLLVDNYSSSNKVQFKPHEGSNGTDPFPTTVHMVKSGFVRDVPKTHPSFHQVRTACHDMNYVLSRDKQKPSYLFSSQNKDPVETENNYNGPGYMTTENHTRFVKQECPDYISSMDKTFAPTEGSGFTHAFNNEPITYRPNECFDGKYPGWVTNRPTQNSEMKKSFRPTENPEGREPFNKLAKNPVRLTTGCRDINVLAAFASRPKDTYTKPNDVHQLTEQRIKKNDPAEHLNMCHATQSPSMTKSAFRGQQPKNDSFHRLGNCDKKEDTGFTQNNCKFVESIESPDSLRRFRSHYKDRFYDKNPKLSKDLPRDDVLRQLSNGFTKSTAVNRYGTEKTVGEEIKNLHSYVRKSVVARFPYTVNDSKYIRT